MASSPWKYTSLQKNTGELMGLAEFVSPKPALCDRSQEKGRMEKHIHPADSLFDPTFPSETLSPFPPAAARRTPLLHDDAKILAQARSNANQANP